MTTASFTSDGSRLTGFTVRGHSGLADSGITDVLGLCAAVHVDETDAAVSLKLPRALEGEAESVCQTLLASLMVYLVQLQEEYPDNIIVMEV